MTLCFDIGANVGSWALANANAYDTIIAVEASPITYNLLLQHCVHPRIKLLNYAVCDNDGKDITFYHSPCHVLSTLNKDWLTHNTSRFYGTAYEEIVCKTVTIDKLIETYGVPALIKIDVESGEYECIRSLTQKVDHLCFEWASETNDITIKCIDYLCTLGFSHFHLQNRDDYTYRPKSEDYYDCDTLKANLGETKAKEDWGMIWCT